MRLIDGVEHAVSCMVNGNNNQTENFNNNNGGAKPGDNRFGLVFIITYIVMLVFIITKDRKSVV